MAGAPLDVLRSIQKPIRSRIASTEFVPSVVRGFGFWTVFGPATTRRFSCTGNVGMQNYNAAFDCTANEIDSNASV